ncbi:hypothetical protein Tco_1294834 [Tanacetum coccineum]
MTRSSNTKVFTPFANPERQFRNKKDVTPIAVHNIYSFYESESSKSESEDINEMDIKTLTLEQYLAVNRNNTQVGVKRHEIRDNIAFEIKSHLLRELHNNTFSGNKIKDAMKHLRKVLEIASLFNTPGISGDDMMLRIFPFTLARAAKRWLGRTSSDRLKTWDELKKVFIRRFCPPSVTFMQVREIHNFSKEEGETLYQTWERFNNLLFKCPFHDLNDYQKERADHSHKWYNGESDRKTSNNNSNFLITITDKLKNLNHDMNDLSKNVHKIHQRSNKEFCHEEELVLNKIKIEKLSMVKLNARCSNVLQNKLPSKEKDPGSFVLPCINGNTTVSNALADLGASISVMSFSMFKRLDFVILDIIEDDKVPIILGRSMLATAHARIDVFGERSRWKLEKNKLSLTSTKEPPYLEELLMDDDVNRDLGNFLQDIDLLPDYEDPGAILLSLNKSPGGN